MSHTIWHDAEIFSNTNQTDEGATVSSRIHQITLKLIKREVTIRSATTADLGSMTSLLGELFSIEEDFTPDVRRQRQGLACLMASPKTTMLVAVRIPVKSAPDSSRTRHPIPVKSTPPLGACC